MWVHPGDSGSESGPDHKADVFQPKWTSVLSKPGSCRRCCSGMCVSTSAPVSEFILHLLSRRQIFAFLIVNYKHVSASVRGSTGSCSSASFIRRPSPSSAAGSKSSSGTSIQQFICWWSLPVGFSSSSSVAGFTVDVGGRVRGSVDYFLNFVN